MKKKVVRYSLLAFVVALLSLSQFVSYGNCGSQLGATCYYGDEDYCIGGAEPNTDCKDTLPPISRPTKLTEAPN